MCWRLGCVLSNARRRVFYGWWVVFASVLGMFFGPPLSVFSFGVFFPSIARDFHASRAAVSFAFTLHNVVGAAWLPVLGSLIGRFGARRIVLPLAGIFAAVLLSALWLGHDIRQFYVFYTLLGLTLPSPLGFGVVVANWFDRRRGLALALSGLGVGVGAIVVPMMAGKLIALFGWRTTYAIFGGILLLLLPVVGVLLRNRPADCGMFPDGVEHAAGTLTEPAEVSGLSWRESWRSGSFWLILAMAALASISLHASILHLPAILTDRGFTLQQAALGSSIVGIAVLTGRLACGYLLDRFFAPRVCMLFYGASVVGILILLSGRSGAVALGASFLLGLGMGAEVDMMAYLVSRYFGLRCFALAYGFAFTTFMAAGAAGPLVMGAVFDRFHSYSVALACFAVALLAAAGLLAGLGPCRFGPKERERDSPAELIEAAIGS
jgi:MFS family permease